MTGGIDDFHMSQSVVHPLSRNKGYGDKNKEMKNILFFDE